MTGETLRKAQEILDGLSMVELGRALSATSKETESLLYNQILIAIAKK